MGSNLEFNHKKATQALNLFAIKSGGNIDKMKALKLIYFADRYHLRKYGRLITNDTYFAMDWGPVASGVRDIEQMNDLLSREEKEYAGKFIGILEGNNYKSLRDVDKNVFSESDIEALNFSWDKFGQLSQFVLSDFTHQYPEWKKHEKDLKISSRIKMELIDFFDDPTKNIEKCHHLSPQEKSDNIDLLQELRHLESLWE